MSAVMRIPRAPAPATIDRPLISPKARITVSMSAPWNDSVTGSPCTPASPGSAGWNPGAEAVGRRMTLPPGPPIPPSPSATKVGKASPGFSNVTWSSAPCW